MTGDPAIRADINLNGTPVRVQYEYARAPKDIILQSPEQELQLKNGDKNVNFMADLDKTLRLNQDEVSFMFNAEIQISETYEATAVEGTASAAYYLGAGAKFLDRD